MDLTVDLTGCRPRGTRRPRPLPAPAPQPGLLQRLAAPDDVSALVASVSLEAYRETLEGLVAEPTRHSLSPQFRACAERAAETLTGDYAVGLESVAIPGGETLNVVADMEGTGEGGDGRRLVHVVAHLDSVNTTGGKAAPAPGADDNASGAAGVLEIARGLSTTTFVHDLRLILFGGEEQGLFGSRQYVARLSAADRARTSLVINMDMIARRNIEAASVLLEGAEVSQPIIDALAASAAAHTDLAVLTSLDPFGSDHVPFLDAGLPAVLTIEGADQLNTDEHTERDLVDRLDVNLALAILRMNVGAIADALEPAATPDTCPPP